MRSKSIRWYSSARICTVVLPTRRYALPRYMNGPACPRLTEMATTSCVSRTLVRSMAGKAGGSILASSAVTCSMVRSLTCCPTTFPSGSTPNST